MSYDFMWIVQYADGTCTPQFDFETGLENRWGDIKEEDIVKVGYYAYIKTDSVFLLDNPRFEVEIGENQEPIVFRRNEIRFDPNGAVLEHVTMYVLGYEQNGAKHLMTISSEGSVYSKME